MYEFCGYVDFFTKITNENEILNMSKAFKKNAYTNIFIDENVALGFANLNNKQEDLQPMSKLLNNNIYTALFTGKLYNSNNLRNSLISEGYKFETDSDIEVVLIAYVCYGKTCVDHFDGAFSFSIYNKNENSIFLGKDRLGLKPLFYTLTNFSSPKFIFSTKIKSILENPDVRAILDKEGLMELIGLGPAHTPGKTYFKNILELKAGEIATFKNNILKKETYWDLETKECLDSEEEAIEKIHNLIVDETKKELISDSKVCTMLSGGLDSSILSKIAKDNISDLTTFSIDYLGNEKNFISNDYQISRDSDYVKIMTKFLNTNHKEIIIDNTTLFSLLYDSLIARDMPRYGRY